MTRSGRKGRILKWAGLVLSLLVVVTWAVSVFWACSVWYCSVDSNSHYHTYRFGSGAGSVFGYYYLQTVPRHGLKLPGLTLTAGRATWIAWRPRWEQSSSTGSSVTLAYWWMMLPLWMPFLIVAVPTGVLWWRDRRRIPPGHCENCGYNLTGNVSGVCPECGEKTNAQVATKG
jgi:hypothetical protein